MSERLFVGIEAHEAALFEGAQRLSETLPGKYHPLANYHVTLAFIGCFDKEPVIEALKGAEGLNGPLSLGTEPEARCFKEGKKAVLYAPVEGNDALGLLAWRVGQCLKQAGIPFEEREVFTPHITLARGVDSLLASGALLPRVRWQADAFCLYASRSGEGGVQYLPLMKFKI